MKVKEIMTAKSIQYCSPETKLHNAARIMKDSNCGALPVIDKDKSVIGMITDRDIALTLARKQEMPVANLEVQKAMTSKVQTIALNEDVTSALKRMRTYKVGRLPVVDTKGKLKGIVSLHNLIARSGNGEGGVELGRLSSPKENLFKTMHAITNRYSNGGGRKK